MSPSKCRRENYAEGIGLHSHSLTTTTSIFYIVKAYFAKQYLFKQVLQSVLGVSA